MIRRDVIPHIEPNVEPKKEVRLPLVTEDRVLRDFKEAYTFIMREFKLKHSIKPCVASMLYYGVMDGWKTLLYPVTYEVLRVVDWDRGKAEEILRLYLENSPSKSGRNWGRIERQINYTLRKKDRLKLPCRFIMEYFACVGKEECNNIRGMRRKGKMNEEERRLFENQQRNAYLNRIINSGVYAKLSPQALKIYTYLVDKKFLTGFDTLYVTYRELSRVLGKRKADIKKYLEELRENMLIVYVVGRDKQSEKKATEVTILDMYKSPLQRIDDVIGKINLLGD